MNNPFYKVWAHLPHFKFEDLSNGQQDRARATFFNARPNDGYEYITDRDGVPFVRYRPTGGYTHIH